MINGNPNPTVGKDEYYTLVDYSLGLAYLDVSSKYTWRIKKKVRGMWKDITKEPPKTGISVPFKFGEAVIGEEFTIEVYKETKNIFTQKNETHKMGEIIVIPKSSKAPKITKVVLFNRGARDINKASYTDRLIARAYCVGMFNQTIDFHLWEDDAAGGGHHAEINKNNRSNRVYSARVNRDGIAEVEISLSADQRVLRQIANRMTMSGDKDEGKYHEFYVTASYEGKILKANERNVAVENPDYKQKPKEYTPKFPATPTSHTPTQQDKEGKIKAAYFVNDKNQKLVKTTVGEEVKVQIITQGMVGKHLQYRVWEYDAGKHDEIYSSPRLKVVGNIMTHVSGFKITKERFQKGVDLPYGDPDEQVQNYFIEVLPLDISVSSKKFGIDTSVGLMAVAVEKTRTPTKVGEDDTKPISTNCGGKFCIKKGDKNELIREINIRLSGFGGNVPTDEFTERTERMIKQFQRDYMKVPETGKICGNVLRAIDEFSRNFDINEFLWKQLKCSCSTKGKQAKSKLRGIQEVNNCDGFGDGTGANTLPEKSNKYEYPGIHRSLLFGLKAVFFYLSKQKKYSFGLISSGYRCRFKNYITTNHQGKAIDIQFNKGNWEIRGQLYKNIAELEKIRDGIFHKYLGAKTGWTHINNFSLEPIGLNKDNTKIDGNHTYSWIHMDVRAFDKSYLADKYFCKNRSQLNGKHILQLAIELGFTDTCSCYGNYISQTPILSNSTLSNSCEDKFKRVSTIILKHEGGYVNDPSDSGGMTNKGISWPIWKKYAKEDLGIEPTEDNLKKLTDEQATIIYKKRYWEPKGFCEINDERVGLMVYDWSITSGGAGKQVQKLLVNEFEQDISIDGGIGPKTIEALNNVQDQDKLLNRIAEIRKQYYTDLAYDKKGKPTKNLKFLKGWHNRVDECLNYTF